ncbi:hypothetical protein CDD81_2036 [Ophiocordyceps australis]|uniref:Uncharacterized protein n=1 Tax=Ophiocordyceps australis TaxID=1399860 RepID=A0A2C5YFF3_9HYPO|nr:hypothetical protein CDD81_2036 [Ophiocordyceps australis]
MAPAATAATKPSPTTKSDAIPKATALKDNKLEACGALEQISELRKKYLANRYLFVTGIEMRGILKTLGASDDHLERLKDFSNHLEKDPTLPYREIRQGRYIFDYGNNSIYRTEKQNFILSRKEGFKRHDSDLYRGFPEIEDDMQQNTALQALFLFKSFFFHNFEAAQRPYQDYTSDKWVCTLFNVRTLTSDETLGEPALEGVHSDGVDHTMVTMVGHDNMAKESAITFVHDMYERLGIRVDEADKSLVRGVAQHWDFLDTLLIVDNEYFHSLTPLWRQDESRRSTRDVLVFFTRKPALEGHASYGVDSLLPHKTFSLRLALPVLHL